MIGRFISADPIVPDPANPQAFNRYSYCLNNPLRYNDPTGNWPEWLDNAVSWVMDAAERFEAAVLSVGQTIGTAVTEADQWIKEKMRDGVNWVLGIEEIQVYYNPLLGNEPVKVVIAQDSGLNLVNGILDIGNAGAMAIGGPVGIISRPNPSEKRLTHECQHIKEQRESGWVNWHLSYLLNYGIGYLKWGSHDEAYTYLPQEFSAREAAGQLQPADPATWATWWPWSQAWWGDFCGAWSDFCTWYGGSKGGPEKGTITP